MALGVTDTKVVALVILCTVSLVLGFVPRLFAGYLRKHDGHMQRTILSALLCVGGGVLLGTSMLHLLGEVREHLEESDWDFEEKPVAEILLVSGFLLIYLLEELVLLLAGERAHHNVRKKSLRHSISCPQDFVDGLEKSGSKDPHADYQKPSQLRDFLTFLALSFHAIFEGMALGLEEHTEDVWILFAGVASHKFAIAFCFGLELVHKEVKLAIYAVYIVTFSAITGVGGGIGIGISEATSQGSAYNIVTAVFLALSAGTLVYVVVFEILARERSKPEINGLIQWTAVFIGFIAMMCVDLFAGHSHSHEEHDHEEEEDHDHEDEDHDHEETTTMAGVAAKLIVKAMRAKMRA